MPSDRTHPSWWEQLRARTASIGVGGMMKMMVRKSIKPILRTRQRWRLCRAERAWLATARVRASESTDRLAEVFRMKLRTALPVGPDRTIAIKDLVERHALDEKTRILEAADRVCDHVFDLLGSGPVKLGPVIDWHTDFKSGYRWNPDLPYYAVRYGDVPGVDVKVPWELSRGQHLPLLAQATWLSGDDRYVNELVAHIDHWIENNPIGRGVNWACPMDVAIRAVNWLWAVSLSADNPLISPLFLTRLAASLMQHGRHVYENLERRDDGITTNHYLADVVGLLYVGLCLPESHETNQWRRFAVRSLVEEMDAQVLPDGVHYESSISYHRLVTEMFLSSAALCRHHGQELPRTFWSRLERMCEFVDAYTKPNGLAPQIGDGDNGRLHILSRYGSDPRDHRHVLGLGALLFDRGEWLSRHETAWLEAIWFGGEPLRANSLFKPSGSRTYPDGGVMLLKSTDDYLLLNCSPVGTKGLGTHKHNDTLAIEVHLGGEDIIVDPGTFLYTSDPQEYNEFRSTKAHSGVMVDDREQNRLLAGKPFCLQPDMRITMRSGRGDLEEVAGEYERYGGSPFTRHRRTVTLDRSWKRIQIRDEIGIAEGSESTHVVRWTFLFDPCCRVRSVSAGWEINTMKQRLLLSAPTTIPDGLPLQIDGSMEPAWVATRYGVRCETKALYWLRRTTLPVTIEYCLERV